jgi:hypothetical protein
MNIKKLRSDTTYIHTYIHNRGKEHRKISNGHPIKNGGRMRQDENCKPKIKSENIERHRKLCLPLQVSVAGTAVH